MAMALALAFASPAWGIVLYPDDTGPAVHPPDSFVGTWLNQFSNVTGTVVAVDPNYVLTVQHTGTGGFTAGCQVSFGGVVYNVTQDYTISNSDCPYPGYGVDLRLCSITTTAGAPANLTSYAPLYTGSSNLSGMSVAMGGFGRITSGAVTDSSGNVIGCSWKSGSTLNPTWGMNTTSSAGWVGIQTTQGNIYVSYDSEAIFNGPTDTAHVDHEASIATGDSGAGWFVDITGNGDWRLVGIAEFTPTPNESLFGDTIGAVQTNHPVYLTSILGILGRTMWTNTGSNSNWSTTGNWTNGTVPNGKAPTPFSATTSAAIRR